MMTRFLSLLFLFQQARAWPGGAGGCQGGEAAVAGLHLGAAEVISSSVTEAGYEVLINDEPGDSTVGVDQAVSITVKGTLRGVLIRVEGPSDSFLLAPQDSDNYQMAGVCEPFENVQGVTHTNPQDKEEAVASFTATEGGEYIIDITVVKQNNAQVSEYSYEQFTLTAGEPTLPIEPGPVEPPADTYQHRLYKRCCEDEANDFAKCKCPVRNWDMIGQLWQDKCENLEKVLDIDLGV